MSAVATVFPLAWMVRAIAPDAALTELGGGGDAHDLDLSPPQRAAVETADVVAFMGALAFQPQVETAVEAATGQVVDVAEIAGEDALLEAGAHAHEEEGEEHTGEEEGQEHAGEEATVDPHLWFDANLMAQVATRLGEAFAAADPQRAATYQDRAATVSGQLSQAAADVEGLLGGDCEFDEAIVSHEAYGYLLEPFGKRQHGVAGVAPEPGASGADLAALVDEIQAEGLRYVLAGPEEGRADAEALAAEAGVELLEILNLEAVTPAQAETGYPDLLRAQAETFATALGCT